MMRSLWTAASGMVGQQFNIDTISHNLSNVNTTGYKQSRADFEDNRDISSAETLEAIWGEAGLPAEAFAGAAEPALLEATAREHNEAVELGITGVPSVRVKGTDAFVSGAQPTETYRRWIERLRDGVLDG